jgi:hypothetical protein
MRGRLDGVGRCDQRRLRGLLSLAAVDDVLHRQAGPHGRRLVRWAVGKREREPGGGEERDWRSAQRGKARSVRICSDDEREVH